MTNGDNFSSLGDAQMMLEGPRWNKHLYFPWLWKIGKDTIESGPDRKDVFPLMRYGYRIDIGGKKGTMDTFAVKQNDPGMDSRCIYTLKDDLLIICTSPVGPRPERFTSSKDPEAPSDGTLALGIEILFKVGHLGTAIARGNLQDDTSYFLFQRECVARLVSTFIFLSFTMRNAPYLISLACTLAAFSIASGQTDDDPKAVMLRDAPTKWKEYRSIARKLQGQATLTTAAKAPFNLTEVRTDHFKQNEKAGLYVQGHTNILDGDKTKRPKSAKVYGQNPKYSFELMRESSTKDWVVAELQIGNAEPLKHVGRPVRQYVLDAVTPQFSGGLPKPLAECLTEKAFVVKAVRRVEIDRKKLVRLDFEYKEKLSDGTRSYTGWMTLDPERYWHITETVVSTTEPRFSGQLHIKYECATGKGRYPIIRRSEAGSDGKDDKGRKHVWDSVAEWLCQQDGAVPDREFKLTAFGLPEPMEIPAAQMTRLEKAALGASANEAAATVEKEPIEQPERIKADGDQSRHAEGDGLAPSCRRDSESRQSRTAYVARRDRDRCERAFSCQNNTIDVFQFLSHAFRGMVGTPLA